MSKKKSTKKKAAVEMGDASIALGQKAQDKIASWASDIGAVPNESHRDRRGWDFIISFPAARKRSTDLFDIGATEATCFVQVKATRGTKRRAEVKTENWRRGIEMPIPFLFVILEYGDGREPERAYVVHLDEALTEQVAKRLWKNPKAQIDLAWSDEHGCNCNADGVFNRIRELIGDDFHAYVDRKRATWKAFESEKPKTTEVRIVMPGERAAADKAMAEWAVGDTDELPIASYRDVQTRYGVQRITNHVEDGITVSVAERPSLGPARLTISGHGEQVELDADVYSSNLMFPFLPMEATRVRLATPFLSVLLGRDVPTAIRLTIDADEADVPVGLLASHAKALRLLAQGGALSVTMKSRADKAPMPPILMQANAVAGEDMEMVTQIAIFEQLLVLHERAGLSPDTPVRPGAILGKREKIATPLALLDPGTNEAELVMPDSRETALPTDDAAAVMVWGVNAGAHHFMIGAVVRGPLSPSGPNDMRLAAVPRVMKVLAVKRDEDRKVVHETRVRFRKSIEDELTGSGLKLLINLPQ